MGRPNWHRSLPRYDTCKTSLSCFDCSWFSKMAAVLVRVKDISKCIFQFLNRFELNIVYETSQYYRSMSRKVIGFQNHFFEGLNGTFTFTFLTFRKTYLWNSVLMARTQHLCVITTHRRMGSMDTFTCICSAACGTYVVPVLPCIQPLFQPLKLIFRVTLPTAYMDVTNDIFRYTLMKFIASLN